MNFDKAELELKANQLAKDYGQVELGDLLAGGVVSDIYSAVLTKADGSKRSIVVKYTKNNISRNKNFSKTDIENSFSKAPETHNLDVNIQNELGLNTPNMIVHFPEEKISLMDNFNDNGYKLLQEYLLEWVLPTDTFDKLGKMIADVRLSQGKMGERFEQVEASRTQFDERFYELKTLLYNGRMEIFNQIEDQFLIDGVEQLVWTDGDQKNIAINEEGEVMVFDMGRSVKCDPDFMIPNLLGHLGLFFIAGFLGEDTEQFQTCLDSFLKTYQAQTPDYELDEEKFANYFTASIVHRGIAMRWIDKKITSRIGAGALKNACMHFGDAIFDTENRITKIADLFATLDKVRIAAKQGSYERPKL